MVSRDNSTSTGYKTLNPQGTILASITDDSVSVCHRSMRQQAPVTMTKALCYSRKRDNRVRVSLWHVQLYDDWAGPSL